MNTVNFLIFFLLSFFSLSSGIYGQNVNKISLEHPETGGAEVKTYAVIYADGLPVSAVWPIGKRLTRDDRTIRHGVSGGNGGNLNLNSRVSLRFIVAPEDVQLNGTSGGESMTWLQACGDNGSDTEPRETFTNLANTGCAAYNYGGRKWRLPTQRELQLIWILRQGIGYAYAGVAGASPLGEYVYWSATETASAAWAFDFSSGYPRSFTQLKSSRGTRVRCVSDY